MKYLLIITILFLTIPIFSLPQEIPSKVNQDWGDLKHAWRANWINHPTASPTDYGVFHFRKTFELENVPEKFIIHVSGDNRYRLFVNGIAVCSGPARGDRLHWRYETVDIADYISTGKNVLAALVYNYGIYKPAAQHSYRTAFILQADLQKHYFINTDGSWKVLHNRAYQPIPIDSKMAHGFYAICPGDSLDASGYPWGWQTIDYNDRNWLSAAPISRGVGWGYMHGEPWYLVPRTIPFMEERQQLIPKLTRTSGIKAHTGFLNKQKSLHVPAHSEVSFLLDQTYLTMGYPQLHVSGGKESRIKITYAEALFDSNGIKGNRNEINGKIIEGVYDVFLADGGKDRTFAPLWIRTWRYIQLDITTKEEDLAIESFTGVYTAYPFESNASFVSNDSSLKKFWETGWRTARLCAQETYYDCPYYEQLQYIGDTRIQALISLYVSGDDRLMRNALELFDDSRIAAGITYSRYPSHIAQFIPPFSLLWIAMIHDYYMHRTDDAFISQFLPGIRAVLDYFEGHLDDNYLIHNLEWFNFADWADEFYWGVPPGIDSGHSTLIALQYVYALQFASDLFSYFDLQDEAIRYQKLSSEIQSSINTRCYDKDKRLYAETPKKEIFAQHANIMAVLTDTAPEQEQVPLITRIINDTTLIECTLYYKFYLFLALEKAGLEDLYLDQLDPWRRMLDAGLTTFAETDIGGRSDIGSRSDCHAWSASPNYFFLSLICGITPAEAGFKSVLIQPSLGNLSFIKGKVPHPQGMIEVNLQRKGTAGLAGLVTLPPDLTGTFIWNDQRFPLTGGRQEIQMK
jgi:alpha-L-rhamnosidase